MCNPSGILCSVAACTVIYPSYFHSNCSKKRKSLECCSIKELQVFKYAHKEQNCAILGGGTSCKLAVFDRTLERKSVLIWVSRELRNWGFESSWFVL